MLGLIVCSRGQGELIALAAIDTAIGEYQHLVAFVENLLDLRQANGREVASVIKRGKWLFEFSLVCQLPDLPVKLLRVLVPQKEHIRFGEHHQFERCSRSLRGVLYVAAHHRNAFEILIAENRKGI